MNEEEERTGRREHKAVLSLSEWRGLGGWSGLGVLVGKDLLHDLLHRVHELVAVDYWRCTGGWDGGVGGVGVGGVAQWSPMSAVSHGVAIPALQAFVGLSSEVVEDAET